MRILVSIFVLFLIFGFQKTNFSTSIPPVDFHEALAKKMISVESISTGRCSGQSVKLKLANQISKNISIKIPALTTYSPEDNGEQTLLQVEEMLVDLDKNESKYMLVPAFCSELSDRAPKKDGKFTIGKSKNSKFVQLANYIQKNPISKSNYQEAVWAISDDQSINHLSIDKPQDKKFRKFMSQLTGQKESWYSSPQQTTIDPYGNINRETVRIAGALKFDSDGISKVHQAIYDSEGKELFTGPDRQIKKVNNVKMTFSIQVKGWKKGDYEVRIIKGETILKKFPFVV